MTEPQIAEAYRARFVGLSNRVDGAERIERDFLGTLDTSSQVFVVVTLVPDLPGDATVDSMTFREFERSIISHDPLLLKRGASWQRATTRHRRLAADGARSNAPGGSFLACELHNGGAGSFAAVVDFRRDGQEATDVEDEVVINAVASGLRFLARHTRDRAAAGGMATARVTLWPVDAEHPARLFHNSGFQEDLGRQRLQRAPVSDGVFDIDDLATDGQPLLAATYTLASRLFQEFGQPEALQLTASGEIRTRYWHSWSRDIVAWAKAAGVPVTEETLP